MGYNVAIDGPAGAGKSTIAKQVAKENGYIYVDTGAMYRGLAIHFLNLGIDPKDTEKIIEACKDVEVTIGYESGIQQIYVNGENVTAKGVQCDLKEIEKDIEERDYRDMTRKIAPLKKAEDAILVDSSDMTLKEVVNTISRYCHR